MSSEEKSIVHKLQEAQMPQLANLYVVVANSPNGELMELGSRSIGPSFADCCCVFRDHMLQQHSIVQKNLHMNTAWAALGDKSGTFYFGGNDWSNGREKPEWLSVTPFIEKMAKTVHEIDLDSRRQFDELCGALASSMMRVTTVGGTH